jgi:type I restriction enzyme M protein
MARRKMEAQSPGANGPAAIVRELWQAAVNLRGSIEPADYKRYVLPIIFLRFLSLRYERRRDELRHLVEDPQSDYYRLPQALEDPDEYRAAGAFVVPEKARWDHLRKSAQADDIKVILDDALELLEKTYPDKLRGLLPRIYAGSNLGRENITGLINPTRVAVGHALCGPGAHSKEMHLADSMGQCRPGRQREA